MKKMRFISLLTLLSLVMTALWLPVTVLADDGSSSDNATSTATPATPPDSIVLTTDYPKLEAVAAGSLQFNVNMDYTGGINRVFDLKTSAPSGWDVFSESASIDVQYCMITGANFYVWCRSIGGNSICENTDPQFVDPDGPDGIPGTLDDDLRLSASSPGIDAGSNSGVVNDFFDLNANGNVSEPLPVDVRRRVFRAAEERVVGHLRERATGQHRERNSHGPTSNPP